MNGNSKFRGSSPATTCGGADAFGSTARMVPGEPFQHDYLWGVISPRGI